MTDKFGPGSWRQDQEQFPGELTTLGDTPREDSPWQPELARLERERDSARAKHDKLSARLPAWQLELDKLRRERDEARADVAALRTDMETAAGEYMGGIPEPGTPPAILLSANVLMRREVATLRQRLDEAARSLETVSRAGFEGSGLEDIVDARGQPALRWWRWRPPMDKIDALTFFVAAHERDTEPEPKIFTMEKALNGCSPGMAEMPIDLTPTAEEHTFDKNEQNNTWGKRARRKQPSWARRNR